MQRPIVGFHQDDVSDWVAELVCGHGQHVRHDPPLCERPWVSSEEGRAGRLGARLECAACERRELPEAHVAYRRTETYSEQSVPRALLSRHTTRKGVWAHIHVESGRLRYQLHEPFDEEQTLEAGSVGVVLPEVEHQVEPLGTVRFFVEFYRAS